MSGRWHGFAAAAALLLVCGTVQAQHHGGGGGGGAHVGGGHPGGLHGVPRGPYPGPYCPGPYCPAPYPVPYPVPYYGGFFGVDFVFGAPAVYPVYVTPPYTALAVGPTVNAASPYSYDPPPISPPPPASQAPPTPVPAPPPPAPGTGGTAKLTVIVPEGGQVWFDGTMTQKGGTRWVYTSPILEPGKTHTVAVKARLADNGPNAAMDFSLRLRAGDDLKLDLTKFR